MKKNRVRTGIASSLAIPRPASVRFYQGAERVPAQAGVRHESEFGRKTELLEYIGTQGLRTRGYQRCSAGNIRNAPLRELQRPDGHAARGRRGKVSVFNVAALRGLGAERRMSMSRTLHRPKACATSPPFVFGGTFSAPCYATASESDARRNFRDDFASYKA